MRPVFLGQAPSRAGDGRPFSGPSGQRLCALLDLANYEELAQVLDLQNLLPHPMPKRQTGKGDLFDAKAARANWLLYSETLPDRAHVICAGKQVAKEVGVNRFRRSVFSSEVLQAPTGRMIIAHVFPHPSGINHWWNDPERVRAARDYLLDVITASRDASA